MFEKKSSFSGSEKVLEKKSSTSELTFKKTSVSASASEKLMDRIKKFSNGGVDLDKAKKTSVTEVIDLKQGEIKEEEFSIFINDQQPKIIEEENLELNQELSSLQEEDATSLVDGRTEDQYLVTEPEVDIPVETGVEIENENHSERSDSFENILEIQDDGQQEFGLRAAMAGEEAAGRQGEVAEQAEWAEKANSSTSTTVALLIKRESTLYAFDNEQKYVAEASFDIVEAVEEDISDNYGQLEDAIVYQRQKLASQSSSYSVTSSNESLVERKLSTPVSDAKSDNFLSSSCKLDVPVVTVEEPDSAPVVFADEDEEHQSFSGYSTPRQISDTESTPTKLEEFDNSKFNFSEVAKSREDHSKIITDYHSRMSNLISEDEVSFLKKQNHDLEMKLKKEEDEIDDLVSQVQMLEQAKLKLEQSITNLKKEHKQECSQKDEEMEELRVNMQKKLKALEQQLESEHDERLAFVREKKEMESKINNLHELVSMRNNDDDDTIIRLRKDLKRTKALLKDAQSMATRPGNDSANKVVVRQLKNQLEDAEYAKIAAMKFRQNLELELTDVQQQLDDVIKAKAEVEDRSLRISREKADLSTHLDEMEEEMQEVMKKYKSSVAQLSLNQITIQDQANRVSELEEERKILKEQVAEMSQKIESLEGETVTDMQHSRLELKIKELESKVELEQTTRGRMETQINRLKEAIEKLNSENDHLRSKELSGQEQCRKLQRQVRDLKEELANIQQRETELHAKKHEMEKQLEISESESVLAKNDLKLALKRIDDLQAAISGEIDSESDSDDSDDSSSDGSEDMYFGSTQHRIIPKIRTTFIRDTFKARHLETMPEEPEYRL